MKTSVKNFKLIFDSNTVKGETTQEIFPFSGYEDMLSYAKIINSQNRNLRIYLIETVTTELDCVSLVQKDH